MKIRPKKRNRPVGKRERRLALGLRWKLMFAIILFGTLVTGILSTLLYTTTRAQMLQDFRQRLREIVGVAALNLDTAVHQRLVSPDQEGNADYMAIKHALQKVQARAVDIHYIYTMRATADGKIMFVVDAETDPAQIAHLGVLYTDASAFLKAHFATMEKPAVEPHFYTDRWGTWLTGYAPFFDAKGKRAGVLGIDIAAGRIITYEKNLLRLFVLMFLGSLVLSVLLGIFIGNRLTKPVLELKGHAERISQGDFDTRIPVRRKDELGVLGHTFNLMGRRLKDLVRALQSEIANREAAEKKYRSIFENAMEGIFQATPEGRLVTANPELAHMLGYDSPGAATAAISDITHELCVDPDRRAQLIEQLKTERRVTNIRLQGRKRDGGQFWSELTARQVLENGETPLIEGLVKDIGEQMEKETAQREEQAARAASLAKSEFLANMSHEIRTPMNAVMGLTHLALKTELTPKQGDYLKKILHAAGALLRIIDDILDFSKIEAGKLSMEAIGFDIEETLASLSTVLSLKAEDKGLELIFHLDSKVPRALIGDPFRLEQVLTNLINNAIKFTESGSILLSIHPASGETPREGAATLEFSVKDTGIGLTEAQQADLFQSFSQADASITRKFGGTGLGLVISKRLVEMMGGRIRVESTAGKGSIFSFTAVFELQAADPAAVFYYPEDLRDLKVLVVDDNPTSRDIICEILESFSFRPHQAPTGQEALADLAQAQAGGDPFQLVIMDWKMPGMDGIEASRHIKENEALARIPSILMLTAYSRDEIRRKAEAAGVDSFLIKPANPSLLFDTILSVFGKSATIQTDRAAEPRHSDATLDPIRGAHLLLVEDNDINRQVAVELLESEGFVVWTADSGKGALDMLSGASAGLLPELVLMDIQMPEMDGYTATARIRDLSGPAAGIPIVAMTAHALQSEREKCLAAGMVDHIAKPIDPQRLFRVLAKWIAPGNRERVSPKATAPAAVIDFAGHLPRFDTAAGLARVADNQSLYRDLLLRFAGKHAGADSQLREHIRQGRAGEARALAHTLKGIAGNLGATALQEAAGKLESALTAGAMEAASSLMDEFSRALADTLADIEALEAALAARPEESSPEPQLKLDPLRLRDLITQIADLVRSDYGLALQQAALLNGQLQTSETGAMVDMLVAHLEAFEETEALDCLDRLADSLGIATGEA